MPADWNNRHFIGGSPVLDFLNTVAGTGKTRKLELLSGWDRVVTWAKFAKLISLDERRILLRLSSKAGSETKLLELIAVREWLHGTLSSFARTRSLKSGGLRELGREVSEAFGISELKQDGERLAWEVTVEDHGLQVIRLRVLIALGNLLVSDEISRLRECGRCSWLFLDHGRGRGRRWCRMDACGNRAKARKYRERHSK